MCTSPQQTSGSAAERRQAQHALVELDRAAPIGHGQRPIVAGACTHPLSREQPQPVSGVLFAAPHGARLRHIRMTPRSWITAGWVSIAAAAGLAVAAISQALDAVSPACVQPFVTTGLHVTCPGAAAGFVRGLICAVLAGVAFFSGLACFFWAAHRRSLQQMMQIRQSPAGTRHGLFG